MTHCPWRAAAGFAAAAAVSLGSTWAIAQTADTADKIRNNDSIFIDGTTFQVIPGKAASVAKGQIKKLGARELGPAAVIFRSDDRLYILDTPLTVRTGRRPDGLGALVEMNEPRPNRIRIAYDPPKNPAHQRVYELLQSDHALETLQEVFSVLRLPIDVTIRSVGCDGVSNAWYERKESRPTVSLCYEYLQEVLDRMPSGKTPAGFTPTDTVIGQFFYAAAHEMGHAVFDIFKIPVFGREEDAADQFATYVMLQFNMDRARRLIGGAAYSYDICITTSKLDKKVEIPLAAFSSNHGTPEERFFNLLCMAYGADAMLFGDMVENGFLPSSRAQSCKDEYRVLTYAFEHQVEPHVDQRLKRQVLATTWFDTKNLDSPQR